MSVRFVNRASGAERALYIPLQTNATLAPSTAQVVPQNYPFLSAFALAMPACVSGAIIVFCAREDEPAAKLLSRQIYKTVHLSLRLASLDFVRLVNF
jgi:hypothetical protein